MSHTLSTICLDLKRSVDYMPAASNTPSAIVLDFKRPVDYTTRVSNTVSTIRIGVSATLDTHGDPGRLPVDHSPGFQTYSRLTVDYANIFYEICEPKDNTLNATPTTRETPSNDTPLTHQKNVALLLPCVCQKCSNTCLKVSKRCQ